MRENDLHSEAFIQSLCDTLPSLDPGMKILRRGLWEVQCVLQSNPREGRTCQLVWMPRREHGRLVGGKWTLLLPFPGAQPIYMETAGKKAPVKLPKAVALWVHERLTTLGLQ